VVYSALADALSACGFGVLLVDFPGHGQHALETAGPNCATRSWAPALLAAVARHPNTDTYIYARGFGAHQVRKLLLTDALTKSCRLRGVVFDEPWVSVLASLTRRSVFAGSQPFPPVLLVADVRKLLWRVFGESLPQRVCEGLPLVSVHTHLEPFNNTDLAKVITQIAQR
jgi:pimeloyl-ACP methyl ester carboxylesterase